MSKRVLMLLENYPYPQDTRVLKETTTLTEAGYRVIVICPAKKGQPARETVNGVAVYRYPPLVAGGGMLGLALEYAWAMVALTVLSFLVWVRPGFDIVHVHNPPDALFLIALPYKLGGKRLVYDQHDRVPELLQAKFGRGGILRRLATFLEGLSCRVADRILTTTESARELVMARHRLPPAKLWVVGNGPDLRRLRRLALASQTRREERTTIVYLGCVDLQDGLESLPGSLVCLLHDFGRRDFRCLVIGDGDALPSLKREAARLGLDPFISFTGNLPWEEAMRLVAAADICVDPAPRNVYHDTNGAVKVLEYMALGKPMVLYDLAGHRAAAAGAALYARAGDEPDFAAKIAQLMDDTSLAQQLGSLGQARLVEQLCWEKMESRLLTAYSELASGGSAP